MFDWYTDISLHGVPHVIYLCSYTCSHRYITVTYAHRTSVHACTVSIFLSSLYISYVLLFHGTVVMLYDCFLLLIWIFPILDMRAVDMRYVESHIYCSRYIVPVILFLFLVILFYAINRALVQLLCYPYHVLYLFLLHCILDISDHKANLGMGETWRLIRSYRVMYWIHIVLPLQGMVVLHADCIASWAPITWLLFPS